MYYDAYYYLYDDSYGTGIYIIDDKYMLGNDENIIKCFVI